MRLNPRLHMLPKARALLARYRLDPGLAVAWLLAAFAAWPFLSRPSLPVFTDAEMHVYRTFEILSAWRTGVPYLRWAPDFFHAFGYPVFNYYAPLTYYLGAAYGWFLGGPVAGVKFVFVAVYFVGATGTYLFVRDQWGGRSGLVSAAAFLFAPYVVYTDTHGRGDSPEAFAIALAPLTFWTFLRLRRTGSKTDIVLAALALAALTLSHNLMALVFFGLLLAWLGWQALWAGTERRGLVVTGGLAVLLGLGLSSFMWLPAILERDAVQFHNMTVGGHYDPTRHLVDASELFAPARREDLTEPSFQFNFQIGVAQWALAVLGVLSMLWAANERKAILFFGVLGSALVFLMLPASRAVWGAVPLLPFLQFPWRLMGAAVMSLSVVAGAMVRNTAQTPKRGAWVALASAAVVACLATAAPVMDPLPWAGFGQVSEQRILASDLNWNVGTTGNNEFLPAGTAAVPGPQPSLIDSYGTGVVDKLNRATLPEGTQASVLEHGPLDDRFLVTGHSPFTLRVFTFYFPGWAAYVDGAAAPITPSEPEGWITLEVPAGTHEVLLRFEDTPPRQLGWALSGLAAACMLGLLLSGRRRLGTPSAPEPLPVRAGLALGLLVLAGLGARAWADQSSWWRVRRESTEVPGAGHAQVARFEGNIALLAYDLPRAARPGERVPLTLYWQAMEVVPANLRVFVHFVGADGQLWGQSDKLHPAGLPTGRWPLDRYLVDAHEAMLRPEAPPGAYTLKVGLWDELTGQRMRVADESGHVTDADGVLLDSPFIVEP